MTAETYALFGIALGLAGLLSFVAMFGVRIALPAIKKFDAAVFVALFAVCAVVAQKGTNDPPRGASAPYSEVVPGNGGDAIATSPQVPRCGDGVSPSLLTAADYETGFVLAEARYGETHDFTPPEGAAVCDDWRAFGAACDWFKADLGGFSFPLGTNAIRSLMVYSFGEARATPRDLTRRIAPFSAPLEIAPQANWPQMTNCPSLYWQKLTPTNTFLMTWLNLALEGDPSRTVSFQVELYGDGCAEFRYDLSLAGCDTITNAQIALLSGTGGFSTNAIPSNLTTLRFQRLDPAGFDNPDPDGDGISTFDEVFVYRTNPYCGDTDYDGLSDYEELFVCTTDPLDPHSLGSVYCDGLALRLDDLDPFSFPEGSTNTVLEHVFYSGTTNGLFAYPQSSDTLAVFQVSVSGFGVGELIVGGQVVPLVAPPQMRSAPPNPMPPLLVQVVKGETYPIWLRGDDLLEVSLSSGDFAFGALPTHNAFGHINFPNTVATPPCIHDFNARQKEVHLPLSKDAQQLTCTWQGCTNVQVENVPPRAATVTGNFPARDERLITYVLSHPQYLFGRTEYSQTVRFCPRPPDPDPEVADPPWYSYGDGYDSTSNVDDYDDLWCCYWGTCAYWCGCSNPDCMSSSPCGGGSIGDEVDFDEECPVHFVPYTQCAGLHEADYTNAVQGVQHLGGVLYIREPAFYEQMHLDVPAGYRNCCQCQDHWTNYVGVAYKSYRLRLLDTNGQPFNRAETSCEVNLAGIYPSSSVGDASLAFSRNGEIYQQQNRTVLGVAIKGGYWNVDLASYNALNSSFGYPMTVCTNAWDAPEMSLVTNVKLPGGNIHLELIGATGQFTVWYYDIWESSYRKLLDTATMPVKDLSIDYWKALMRRSIYGESPGLPIYITSATPGAVDIKFRYWNVVDGKFVQDEATQRITSIRPPLRFDINRDGSIDDGDSDAWLGDRCFYHWINEDRVKGDRVGQVDDQTLNVRDSVVNGTFDLVNLFPVALDLSKFAEAWQNRVTYTLYPEHFSTNSFNFCFADVPWGEAGSIQTTNVTTTSGIPLHYAQLNALPVDGALLPYSLVEGFSENSGLLICEAKSRNASMRIDIKAGDTLLYSYVAPMTTLPVKEMYSWYNFRGLSGALCARESESHSLWNEPCTKSLVFLHGVNVDELAAEQWGDILFKRLWLSGSRARFYNVGWRSDIGSDANYQENASNAFVVASQIVSTITNEIPGEKVVMAHSLGNMVVSSMIQDHGLQVSKYLMCDSAVPSEAYYPANDVSIRVPQLVHPQWEEYPTNSWASNWHKLFAGDPMDDRRLLGWPGRFSDVAQYAVSFYSTGDQVLELSDDNDIYVWTGSTSGYVQYCWHHQELWKGRGAANMLGGTTWSGWNIEENWLGIRKISVSEAQQMQPEDFRTNTVFYCYPSSMNSTNISLLVRAAHLTQGIPALARPTGGRDLYNVLDWRDYINLNLPVERQVSNDGQTITQGIPRPNGWPTRSRWNDRWLHSDMKDVSYYFNFKFYEKLVEKGELR